MSRHTFNQVARRLEYLYFKGAFDLVQVDEEEMLKDKNVHWKRRVPRKMKVKYSQDIKGNHYDKRRGMHVYQKKGSRQWSFSDMHV